VDRFEEGVGNYGVPAEKRRGFQIQGKAKALYTFSAQNPRFVFNHHYNTSINT